MPNPIDHARNCSRHRKPSGAGHGRRRRPLKARAVLALLTISGTLALGAPGAAAADSAEVENCSDGQNFCSALTVERTTTQEPPEQQDSNYGSDPSNSRYTINYCGSFYIQSNGDLNVNICDTNGNVIDNISITPVTTTTQAPRLRPSQSTIISSSMGALNPPRPTIHTSPRYASGLLVQTPTWLWLPASYWRTYSTTIMVKGYAVTLYATPTTVRWNMGNGDSITCVGPGTPWIPGLSGGLASCKYTYRHSSASKAGDRYKITATVTFVGSYTTVGLGGMRGSLGAVTRSSSVYAPVAEIQGLVV